MQQPQWQIKNILKQFEMLNWKYDRYRTPVLCTQEFVEKYFCSQKLKCVEEIKRKIMQKQKKNKQNCQGNYKNKMHN